jgi:CheY-like chemotaxis protein
MTLAGSTRINGTGRRILVVDDDLSIRVLLNAVLSRLKFSVDLAEDGAEGLQMLQKNSSYDLILLDLMMPRLNGYEFIKRVRNAFIEHRPHIIVFTAAGQRAVNRIPSGAVCNSILKPFDLETFLEMVSECIDQKHTTAWGPADEALPD